MSNTREDMVVDSNDPLSQPVDRAGKRGLKECEEQGNELVYYTLIDFLQLMNT